MAAVRRMSTGTSSMQPFANKRRISNASTIDEELNDAQDAAYALGSSPSAAAASSEAVAVSSWDAQALKEQVEAEAEEAQAAHTSPGAAERSTCAAGNEEDDDNSDASTTASVGDDPTPESPRARWAALAISDGEEEETEAAGSSALPLPAEALAKAKTRWADLVDSDDEEAASSKVHRPRKPVQQGGAEPSERTSPALAQQGGSSSSQPPAEAIVDKDAQWKSGGKKQRGSGGESAAAAPPARGAKRRSGSDAAASTTAERRSWKGASAWAEHGSNWQTGGSAHQKWWQHAESRGSGSWSGAGWNQAGRYSKPSPQGKRQCQFMIGIEEEPDFSVKSKVIGRHGQNMKSIAEKTGAKLRLRGRGSGFLEGEEQKESADPLMLCVSAPDAWTYQEAHWLAWELLENVHSSYRSFCAETGWPEPEMTIEVHEGPRPGSY